MYSSSMHPIEDLANDSRKLGVRPADTVMLHASPRSPFRFWGSELPLAQRLIVELLLKKSNNCAISN